MTSNLLQGLTTLRIRSSYRVRRTVFAILAPGATTPIARLAKPAAAASVRPYELLPGPDGGDCVARLAGRAAFAPDGTRLVDVTGWRGRGFGSGSRELALNRPGRSAITTRATARTRWRGGLPVLNSLVGILPLHLVFEAEGRPVFELTRAFGLRERFTVRLHDADVDPVTVLAAFLTVRDEASADLRRSVAGFVATVTGRELLDDAAAVRASRTRRNAP